jgi:uncharacterized protein (TIGR01244 family)
MEINTLTPRYSVAPQIESSDLSEIAAQGFSTVICNRPDDENPPPQQAETMKTAAEALGLRFHYHPLTRQTFTPERIAMQKQIISESAGPVLAYCASGTRSCMAWALGASSDMNIDEILGLAQGAGYNLEGMRPVLENAASSS